MKLGPVLVREAHAGQHIVLGDIHQIGQLGQSLAELVCDPLPSLTGVIAVGLLECLPDGGRDDCMLAL